MSTNCERNIKILRVKIYNYKNCEVLLKSCLMSGIMSGIFLEICLVEKISAMTRAHSWAISACSFCVPLSDRRSI